MMQVQLAFSMVVLYLMENEFGLLVTKQDREDYIHLWRYIGHHLGIDDEANACTDSAKADQLVREFLSTVPHYARHVRPSTRTMVRITLQGFGRYTGVGEKYMTAIMLAHDQEWLNPTFMNFRPVIDYPVAAVSHIRDRFRRLATSTFKLGVMRHFLRVIAWADGIVPSLTAACERYILPRVARAKDSYWAFWDRMYSVSKVNI